MCLLETNVGVSNQKGAEDGVHDGVEGAGGEGGDGEGDQANADSSVGASISMAFARSERTPNRTSRTSSGSYPPWGGEGERERGRSLSKSVRIGCNGRLLSRFPQEFCTYRQIEQSLGVCCDGVAKRARPGAREWFGYSRHTGSFNRLCTSNRR